MDKKILIVDDEIDLSTMLKKYFELECCPCCSKWQISFGFAKGWYFAWNFFRWGVTALWNRLTDWLFCLWWNRGAWKNSTICGVVGQDAVVLYDRRISAIIFHF